MEGSRSLSPNAKVIRSDAEATSPNGTRPLVRVYAGGAVAAGSTAASKQTLSDYVNSNMAKGMRGTWRKDSWRPPGFRTTVS